jgi:hypothetical protein
MLRKPGDADVESIIIAVVSSLETTKRKQNTLLDAADALACIPWFTRSWDFGFLGTRSPLFGKIPPLGLFVDLFYRGFCTACSHTIISASVLHKAVDMTDVYPSSR